MLRWLRIEAFESSADAGERDTLSGSPIGCSKLIKLPALRRRYDLLQRNLRQKSHAVCGKELATLKMLYTRRGGAIRFCDAGFLLLHDVFDAVHQCICRVKDGNF